MISEIVLLRHGITEGNKKHWYYGWTDVPLLEEGRSELARLRDAGIYPPVAEDAPVFRSEFQRTRETLEILYGPREATVVPELDEYNFGRFEALTIDQFEDDPDFIAWRDDPTGTVTLAGGDSTATFAARVGEGIQILLKAHVQYQAKLVAKRTVEAVKLAMQSLRPEDFADASGAQTYTTNLPGGPQQALSLGKTKHIDAEVSTDDLVVRSLAVIHGGVISQMMRQMFPDLPGTKYQWVPMPGMGFAVRIENGKPASFREICEGESCRTAGVGYPVEI